jgi:hypothetical protein
MMAQLSEADSIYEWAVKYVYTYGFSVFPVRKNDKRPAISSWIEYQNRLPTHEELKEWFGDGKYNIAIVTGKVSNLTVVDVDNETGYKFFKEHQKEILPTPIALTRADNNHFHLFFRYKEGIRNIQAKTDESKFFDVRSEGGYVVASPSMFYELVSQDGNVVKFTPPKVYRWSDKYPLETTEIAEIPEVILKALEIKKSKHDITELYKGAGQGSRNETLARLAGSWINDGLSYEDCLENAITWNTKNNPPLNIGEIERTLKSIYEKHRRIDILPDLFEMREIPFGYELFYPKLKMYFTVKSVFQDKDGIKCYLKITSAHEQVLVQDLYSANYNFHSSTGTRVLVNALKLNVSFISESVLSQLVESFKKEFLKRYVMASSEKITDIKVTSYEPKFLIEPFILEGAINLIYGAGSTGKSTYACYLATRLDKLGYNVLYLDYENPNTEAIARTIRKITGDAKNIYIRACHTRLGNEIEQIYNEVKEKKIDVIIVDSVVKSMVSDVFSPEAVSLYSQTLLKIPTTWLLLSHVAKNSDNPDPYGSVFFFNDARNIWYAKKVSNKDGIVLQLVHKKSNFTRLYEPEIFEIKETENKRFSVEKKTLADVGSTLKEMILSILEYGEKPLSEIQQLLPGTNNGVLRKTLSKMKAKGYVENERGVWFVSVNDKAKDWLDDKPF